MPKNDPEILRMALAGYEAEKLMIDGRIQEVRAMLDGGNSSSPAVVEEGAPVRKPKRRRMSAAARKRIGDAARARWAALRGEKATATKRTTSKKRPKLSAADRLKISGGQAKWKKNEVPF